MAKHSWAPGSETHGLFRLIGSDENESGWHGYIEVLPKGTMRLTLITDGRVISPALGARIQAGETILGRTRDNGQVSLCCRGSRGFSYQSNGFQRSQWVVSRLVDGDHIDLALGVRRHALRAACPELIPMINGGSGYREEVDQQLRGITPFTSHFTVSFTRNPVKQISLTPSSRLKVDLLLTDEGKIEDHRVDIRRRALVQWKWKAAQPLPFNGLHEDVQLTASLIGLLIGQPVRFPVLSAIDQEGREQFSIHHPRWIRPETELALSERSALRYALNTVGWKDFSRRWWRAWKKSPEVINRLHRLLWHDDLPVEWEFFYRVTCFEALLMRRYGEKGDKWLVESTGRNKGKDLSLKKAMNAFKEHKEYKALLSTLWKKRQWFLLMCDHRNTVAHSKRDDRKSPVGAFAAQLHASGALHGLVELMLLENMGFSRQEAIEIVRDSL